MRAVDYCEKAHMKTFFISVLSQIDVISGIISQKIEGNFKQLL